MQQRSSNFVHRELLLTPEAKRCLEGEYSQEVRELAEAIARALDDRDKKDGAIRLIGNGYLLFIINPERLGEPDRVVVWHGPTDDLFFKPEILGRTHRAGANFL